MFNIFAPKNSTPAPAPAPAAAPAVPGGTMQQNNPGADPSKQQAHSPLDSFTELLKNSSNDQATSADPFSSPLFTTDPKKISEVAGNANFLANIDPALLEKAQSGQDPQAFLEVMNKVGQQSLALAVQLAVGTTEQAGTKIGERFKKALPDLLKDTQLRSIKSENPILNHPSAEPMLVMLRDRIRRNAPDMSPQEINAKAEEYLLTWAKELAGPGESSTTSQSAETDWERFAANL
jgi:hypothetical protein